MANIVANMNTVGFRAEEIRFEEVLSRTGLSDVSFSGPRGVHYSPRNGAAITTKNATDLLINGDGWFSVIVGEERGFTRDGRFNIDAGGELKTIQGGSVLDGGGAPIVVDPQGGQPIVARDGTITQNGAVVAKIGVFKLDPNTPIARSSSGIMVTDQQGTPLSDFGRTSVLQGSIEGSNVNPVAELTNLILVQRIFESVSGSVQTQEETLGEAIRLLGPTR